MASYGLLQQEARLLNC